MVASVLCVLLVAGCGGGDKALTLRSVESAVRSAGFSHLRVSDASVAIARLRADGHDVSGLRQGTPDYVIPRPVPILLVARYTSMKRAEAVRKPYATRVCNVVVFDIAPKLKAVRNGAARVVAVLRKSCPQS